MEVLLFLLSSLGFLLSGGVVAEIVEAGLFSINGRAIMSGPSDPRCDFLDTIFPNTSHAFVRDENKVYTGFAIPGVYNPDTNSVKSKRMDVAIEDGVLMLKGHYPRGDNTVSRCDFVMQVDAGSILGVKGPDELDEAGLTVDDPNRTPPCLDFRPVGKVGWVVSGSFAVWGDMAGVVNPDGKTATMVNDTPDPDDEYLVLLEVNHYGELTRTEAIDGKSCPIPILVTDGTVLGSNGSRKPQREGSLRHHA